MEPTFNDYVALLYNRFEAFVQSSEEEVKLGAPKVYSDESLIVFFIWMQFKMIYQFKSQWNWLKQHEDDLAVMEWKTIPDRSTLSRRYKALSDVIQAFSAYLWQASTGLGEEMRTKRLNEYLRYFNTAESCWHHSYRK